MVGYAENPHRSLLDRIDHVNAVVRWTGADRSRRTPDPYDLRCMNGLQDRRLGIKLKTRSAALVMLSRKTPCDGHRSASDPTTRTGACRLPSAGHLPIDELGENRVVKIHKIRIPRRVEPLFQVIRHILAQHLREYQSLNSSSFKSGNPLRPASPGGKRCVPFVVGAGGKRSNSPLSRTARVYGVQ